jgi:hypothetical protein
VYECLIAQLECFSAFSSKWEYFRIAWNMFFLQVTPLEVKNVMKPCFIPINKSVQWNEHLLLKFVNIFHGECMPFFLLLYWSCLWNLSSSCIVTLIIGLRAVWIDLFELSYCHRFCETVWKNLWEQFMTIIISLFQLIFIRSPI